MEQEVIVEIELIRKIKDKIEKAGETFVGVKDGNIVYFDRNMKQWKIPLNFLKEINNA